MKAIAFQFLLLWLVWAQDNSGLVRCYHVWGYATVDDCPVLLAETIGCSCNIEPTKPQAFYAVSCVTVRGDELWSAKPL